MEKKTTASYLVTAALAASLGYVGGLQGAGVSEVQASYKREKIVTNMPLTPASKACFEACLDSAMCPRVDAALGLTGKHACSAAKNSATFCVQTQRELTETDPDTRVVTPLPDVMSLSGTTEHDMVLTQPAQ